MTDSNYFDENDEWKEEDDDYDSSPNLYSLLNLSRDANEEEVHRSYRSLSTTFHPDKVAQDGNNLDMEEIQETFLLFKKAHDVLIDPVLRLAYDHYGEDGVELVRRVQQQQREQKMRRDERNGSGNGEEHDISDDEDDDVNDDYDESDGGDEDEEEDEYNLYERLEDLLVGQKNAAKAKAELDQFMEQHHYQQNLTEDNYVHLNLSMTFPPAVPLIPILYQGRDYLKYVQKTIVVKPPKDEEERDYYRQRIMQERRLVDYQISQLRSSQKADVGFTLSSVQPPRTSSNNKRQNQQQLQPNKWSMAVGCSTDLIYPGVAEIANMAKEIESKKNQEEYVEIAQKHPVSAFINTNYTPNPQTQISGTANLNNDNESHQYSLGSTHTFSNQTACRYGLTYLTRSPFPDGSPIIFNLKSYRHLQNIGTTSVGVSASSTGQVLQWNAKWETTKISKSFYNFVHKVSAKAAIGILQGNSLEFGYTCKFPKPRDEGSAKQSQNSNKKYSQNLYEWLSDNVCLPKHIEVSTLFGHFKKVTAMVTQEIACLATRPTLGFGMEHDISLGRWAWIWEIQYNASTFRIPISILQLGSVTDPRRFYAQKFYYGMYCLLLQSLVADLLGDNDSDRDRERGNLSRSETSKTSYGRIGDGRLYALEGASSLVVKTKSEADQQLTLMKPISEKKRYRESQLQRKSDVSGGGGLIILGATYWQKFSLRTNDESDGDNEDSWVHEIVSMDATVQLQFWVRESRLLIPGKLPKSSLMGFYSLHTESKLFRKKFDNQVPKQQWWSSGRQRIRNFVKRWRTRTDKTLSSPTNDSWQDPQLTVRYSFDGSVYEITVGDTESLELHCENDKAENLGDSSFVQ